MDSKVMELRIKQWIPVFEEQVRSGLSKDEWCQLHSINKSSFYRWQKRVRLYLLEHDGASQQHDPVNNEKTDGPSFVELSAAPISIPRSTALGDLYNNPGGTGSPLCIHYREFTVGITGMVDEKQLSSVLRALKYVD